MNAAAVIEHIVKWLKDYSVKSGTKGFVIGISGGIDSAVTSTLCAKTGAPVICLNLPIHQHKAEYDRGHEHIKWLQSRFDNVTAHEIELTKTYEAFYDALPADFRGHLAMANSRSRLRMTALYAVAGHSGMLVAGTGNKVEDFGIGFYTKYGDGGVDLSPIADLMKSEVYELAKEMGVVSSIRQAAPTDGLFHDSRSDEDQIGATYPELEWAMSFLEKGGDLATVSGRQKEVLEIYRRRNLANRHKMEPIPVCIIPEELKKK